MMTELCKFINNWFEREKYKGTFVIENGVISMTDGNMTILNNQYFRIIGSVFNDGVHRMEESSNDLIDESFVGEVWAMAVPPSVIALADEIYEWQDKYGGVNSVNMSPYNSESFGGYSYSKSGGGSSAGTGTGTGTWQSAFANRLNMWRKI